MATPTEKLLVFIECPVAEDSSAEWLELDLSDMDTDHGFLNTIAKSYSSENFVALLEAGLFYRLYADHFTIPIYYYLLGIRVPYDTEAYSVTQMDGMSGFHQNMLPDEIKAHFLDLYPKMTFYSSLSDILEHLPGISLSRLERVFKHFQPIKNPGRYNPIYHKDEQLYLVINDLQGRIFTELKARLESN